jgi:non-homologous end joining protein Ku
MRRIWSGNIKIGLVNIPFATYNLYHNPFKEVNITKCCNAPVKIKKFCSKCGREDYEVVKMIMKDDQVVTVEKETDTKRDRDIEIVGFLPVRLYNPLLIDKTYSVGYWEEVTVGLRAFLDLLVELGVVAIGKTDKGEPVAFRGIKDILLLDFLKFPAYMSEPVRLKNVQVQQQIMDAFRELIKKMIIDKIPIVDEREKLFEVKRDEDLEKKLQLMLVEVKKQKKKIEEQVV